MMALLSKKSPSPDRLIPRALMIAQALLRATIEAAALMLAVGGWFAVAYAIRDLV